MWEGPWWTEAFEFLVDNACIEWCHGNRSNLLSVEGVLVTTLPLASKSALKETPLACGLSAGPREPWRAQSDVNPPARAGLLALALSS